MCASYTNRRRGNCLFCSTLTHKSVNWKVEWEENLSLFKKQKKESKRLLHYQSSNGAKKRARESRFSFSKENLILKLFVNTSSVCRRFSKGTNLFMFYLVLLLNVDRRFWSSFCEELRKDGDDSEEKKRRKIHENIKTNFSSSINCRKKKVCKLSKEKYFPGKKITWNNKNPVS